MSIIQELTIQNGLPKSHAFVDTTIEKKTIPGIIWSEEDIHNQETMLLYHDWATVHFASPWYEIEAEPEINAFATQRDIKILQKILGESFQNASTVIDIHCGSGRHVIDLAKKGFTVIGMEEVEMPLEQARKYAKQQYIPVTFELSHKENHKKYEKTADIVISMFNSLGYTFSKHDDQEQFAWVMHLLKPGGYFVLDIRTHEYQKKHFSIAKTHRQPLFINKKEVAIMDTTKFWQNNTLGAIEKIVSGDKILQQTTYGWNTYEQETLRSMLENAGARLVAIQEDYYRDISDMGERSFVVAQKR